VLWEPNFLVDQSRPPLPADYDTHLNALVAADRRGDAVEYFITAAVGMPAQLVTPMRQMPMGPAMEAVAHTLAYDGAVVADTLNGKPVTPKQWAAVTMPALVIDGGTTPWLRPAPWETRVFGSRRTFGSRTICVHDSKR
jgi:hypothetical protein